MRKALHIIKNIFVWIIVFLAVAMMIFTIVSVTTFDRNDRDLFGYKAFIVRSDSMSATDFKAGDLIFVKETDPSVLKAGDIISFTSANTTNFGEVVTHKIRSIITDEAGSPGFVTYGTTTNVDDESIVTYEYVLGKYTGNLPGVGSFFMFLKTTPGYFICIFLPFLLLILVQGINSIKLFRQYKAEQKMQMEEEREKQKAEMDAERQRLETERAASQEMMAELLKLKQEIAAKKDNGGTAEDK